MTVKSNKPPLIRALSEAKTKDFTLKIIDGADHGFSTKELVQKGEMLPETLNFISNWILTRAN